MRLYAFGILLGAWLVHGLACCEPEDWRTQILKEEGLTLKEAEQKFLKETRVENEEEFLELVESLGSAEFATRVRAQKRIEDMGRQVVPLLEKLPEFDDPEVRFRLEQIGDKLFIPQRWSKTQLIRHAVLSLSADNQEGGRMEKAPTVFVELFQDMADPIDQTYRHFDFIRDEGLKAKVEDGVLRISGKHGQDGDQRLVLESEKITGEKTFPDHLVLEVSAKATPGGEGIFHLGVSVGNVRALFHPGYRGGGFRFERVDNKENIKANTNMGFTPKVDQFHLIRIEVNKTPDGQFDLRTFVQSEGEAKPFETRIKVPAEDIGELGSIELARSGNPGGDVVFDDLVIEMKTNPAK